jgi:hypothetical protein
MVILLPLLSVAVQTVLVPDEGITSPESEIDAGNVGTWMTRVWVLNGGCGMVHPNNAEQTGC